MTGGVGRGFFTEMLKGDLQEIRKTLEAYTAATSIEGEEETSACGVGYSKDKKWNLIVKVTTGNQGCVTEQQGRDFAGTGAEGVAYSGIL